jgi:hypothetical protein
MTGIQKELKKDKIGYFKLKGPDPPLENKKNLLYLWR